MQKPTLGTSYWLLNDIIVRVLQILGTSGITTVMAFEGATVAQLYRMVELMNSGRIVDVFILIGTIKVSRSSDSEGVHSGVHVTAVWQKFQCAVLTVCTISMNARTQSATARRHNERVVRGNKIVCILSSRNAG